MKTLLFAILFFLMFGWLGVIVFGVSAAVLLDWAIRNWGLVALLVAATVFGPMIRRWNETSRKANNVAKSPIKGPPWNGAPDSGRDSTGDTTRSVSKGAEEKTCPRCAERIKAAALVCRFCGHEFTPESATDELLAKPQTSAGVAAQPIVQACATTSSPTDQMEKFGVFVRRPIGKGRAAQPSRKNTIRLIFGVIIILLIVLGGAFAIFDHIKSNGAERVLPNKMITWDATKDGNPKTYTVDDISLTFSLQGTQDGGNPSPVLIATATNGQSIRIIGENGSGAVADFGVEKLDPSNPNSQIIFSTFTGGAHCCFDLEVLELLPKGWKILDAPAGGQAAALEGPPTLINDNGLSELILTDDRFAYAFSDYASSWLPPRLFVVKNSLLTEVTKSEPHSNVFRSNMSEAKKRCLAGDGYQNGACAGFVADAARLGQFESAWKLMLANYNQKDDWDLPTGCRVPPINNVCPTGSEITFTNYPDALASFLRDTGYITSTELERVSNPTTTQAQALPETRLADQSNPCAGTSGDTRTQCVLDLITNKNYAAARKVYGDMASSGDDFAAYSIGETYEKGEGAQVDYVLAYKWYDIAVALNARALQQLPPLPDPNGPATDESVKQTMHNMIVTAFQKHAISSRDQAAVHLNPAQLVESQNLSRQWQAAYLTPPKPQDSATEPVQSMSPQPSHPDQSPAGNLQQSVMKFYAQPGMFQCVAMHENDVNVLEICKVDPKSDYAAGAMDYVAKIRPATPRYPGMTIGGSPAWATPWVNVHCTPMVAGYTCKWNGIVLVYQ